MISKITMWGLGLVILAFLINWGAVGKFAHAETTRSNHYEKRSVDNTPQFVYTDTGNGCRYLYDAVTKKISLVKGYEHCTIPDSLE